MCACSTVCWTVNVVSDTGSLRGTVPSLSSSPYTPRTLTAATLLCDAGKSMCSLTWENCMWMKTPLTPVCIYGVWVETAKDYKCLGVHNDSKISFIKNTEVLSKNGIFWDDWGRLISARWCWRCFMSLWWPVPSSVLWCAEAAGTSRLNKLTHKVSNVMELLASLFYLFFSKES